jgi:alanyl-tRNA synthetase
VVNGISIISTVANEPFNDPSIIKDVAFQLKSEISDLFMVIGAITGGKPFLAVALSDKLIQDKKLHAGEIVKIAAKEFDGGGGGQAFYANAGGKDVQRLEQAMKKALELAAIK